MTIKNLYYQKYLKYKNKYFNLQNEIVSKYHNNIQNVINNKYDKLLEKDIGHNVYHKDILNAIKKKDYTDINTKNKIVNNLVIYTQLILSTYEMTSDEYLTLSYVLNTNKILKSLRFEIDSMPKTVFEKDLANNTTITKLEIYSFPFNIALIGNALITNKTLITLIIIIAKFTDNDFIQFCNSIRENIILTKLKLNNIYNDENETDKGLSNLMASKLGQVLEINKTLTELDLENNNIKHVGFINIRDALKLNNTLQIFNINDNNLVISQNLLSFLKENKSITELYLGGNRIEKKGITFIAKNLKQNMNLKILHLYSINDTIMGYNGAIEIADALITNTTLIELDIGGNNIGIIGAIVIANALEKNKTLRYLYLYRNSITDDGAIALTDALEYNTSLRMLDITENTISNYLVAKLNDFTKGKIELNVDINEWEVEKMTLPNKLVQIDDFNKYLEILNTKCYEKSIESWINQLKITKLEIDNIDTQKIKILGKILKKNRTLTSFNISIIDNKSDEIVFSDVEVKAISDTLETSIIDDKSVETIFQDVEVIAIVDALKTNTTLTELSITYTNISIIGFRALAEALKQNKTLLKLNLTGNKLDSEGIKEINDALKTNITLQNVKLNFNKDSKTKISELELRQSLPSSPILEINTKYVNSKKFYKYLQKLDTKCYKKSIQSLIDQLKITILNFFPINYKLLIIFGEILKTNTTLKKVEFSSYNSNDKMQDLGVIALAEALEKNTTLTSISLYDMKIGNEGTKAIAEALEINTTLIELELHQNIIDDEGAKALAEALKTNTTLKELDLSVNKISKIGVDILANVLQVNTTLEKLNLMQNIKITSDILKRYSTRMHLLY